MRIRQHEAKPFGRVVRIEWQIGGTGFEDAEKTDNHLQRAIEAQPHHALRSDAILAQPMRQLVGLTIQRGIGCRS